MHYLCREDFQGEIPELHLQAHDVTNTDACTLAAFIWVLYV